MDAQNKVIPFPNIKHHPETMVYILGTIFLGGLILGGSDDCNSLSEPCRGRDGMLPDAQQKPPQKSSLSGWIPSIWWLHRYTPSFPYPYVPICSNPSHLVIKPQYLMVLQGAHPYVLRLRPPVTEGSALFPWKSLEIRLSFGAKPAIFSHINRNCRNNWSKICFWTILSFILPVFGTRSSQFNSGTKDDRSRATPPVSHSRWHLSVIFGVISMIERGLDGKQSNHTHLLRTVIANSDVECILRAKNTPVNLTGESWWHDPRKIEK